MTMFFVGLIILRVLVGATFILGIVLIIKSVFNKKKEDIGIKVLKRRFASGDISVEEFNSMKSVLEQS